jgi:aldose sugar dehydrogenase
MDRSVLRRVCALNRTEDHMTHVRTLLHATTALLVASAASAQSDSPVDQGAANRPDVAPAFEAQTRAAAVETDAALTTTEIAGGLEHPWGIAVLPDDGGYLVTERPGRLVHISRDGEVSEPIAGVPEVLDEEQGGLLDVELGPNFAEDRMVYFTYAKPMMDDLSATAAARAVLSEDMTELTDLEDIFLQAPGSPTPMHYGSRIVFDGEGFAFITTGEHFTEEERRYAQDLDKTYGKIVRVGLDGTVPDDNPFIGEPSAQNNIWTLGHRNIQGAAIRPDTGQLWIVEHGPAGGDELNLIERGANYGWPVVSYGINYDGSVVGEGLYRHDENGFVEPVYYWDPSIAPGDMTFYDGDMFEDWQGDILIGGLVSGGIVRLVMEGDRVTGEERLVGDLGRTRDVVVDSDGSVLAITDFADGGLFRITPQDQSATQ